MRRVLQFAAGLFAFAFFAASFIDPSTVAHISVFDLSMADMVTWMQGGTGLTLALLPAVTTTDLVTEFGDYYVNQGQNMQSLLQKLRVRTATPNAAIIEYTENTVYRRSQSILSEIVQAFQRPFTTKGSYEFKPRTIDLYRLKFDIALHPDDIVGTWVGFLEGEVQSGRMTTDMARAQWPLVRYMIEMDVFPQIQHDLETKLYYKGEYLAPTANVAGATINAMSGIRKWLKDGLASHGGDGSILELSDWGGVSPTTIFDKAESIIETLGLELENEPLIMCMSPKNVREYLRDRRNQFGDHVEYNSSKLTLDFYENCRIIGLPSMAGTDDLFITPARNFKFVRRAQSLQQPKIEELKREVFLMLDWWEGIGFDLNELVYAYVEQPGSGSGSGA